MKICIVLQILNGVVSKMNKKNKPMVGWWTGKKPCNSNKEKCTRPGGSACKRRAKRLL